jgi:hypothetical protein
MNRTMFSFIRVMVCGLFLLSAIGTAHAQFKAAIQGTVQDSAGQVVAGATVTLISKETAKQQVAITNDDGFYRISSLAPGLYNVTAEKTGFKKQLVEDLKISAEAVQGTDFTLEAGGISETVTVKAEDTPALKTEDANVDRAISTQEVLRLPQTGRDPYELARLTPGVFGDGSRGANGSSIGLPNTTGPGGSNVSIFQTENQVPISANGQRVSANSFQIDGVSVNSQTWGGAAVITPSQEAVKEVRVLSSSYSAEDGRNSGAQIKVVTQNGTNEFHGSAFFKYDEPGLNARNKFNGLRVQNKFRQFGGSLGGPIVRDKLFFFFAYEGLRSKNDNPYTAWIETPEFRQLVRTGRSGGVTAQIFGAVGIEPRVISVIPQTCAQGSFGAADCRVAGNGLDLGSLFGTRGQYVPLAGSFNTGGGFDNVPDIQFALLSNPSEFTGHQFHTKINYELTSNDSIALTTIFTPQRNLGADSAARSRPMADILSQRLNWETAVLYNRVLSTSMANEARFNITRWGYNEIDSNPDVNFGIPRVEVEGLPFDRIRFGANRSEGTPGIFSETQLEFSDTLTKITGNHALKVGGAFRRELNDNSLIGGGRPVYSFVRLWNLANDTPIFEGINADPTTGAPAGGTRKYRGGDYALFVQDDWKYRPNLTLQLGLRYEYFTPLRDAEGKQSNLFFGSQGLVNSKVQVVENLYQPDRNNFAPQVGFAWSPKRFNDKAVLRGGFGIGYNRLPEAIFLNTRGNPPFLFRFNICCGTSTSDFSTPFAGGQIQYSLGTSNSPLSYPANPVLGQGIDPATGGPRAGSVEIYGSPQSQPNAYIYRYSLEGEVQLPYKLTANLGYQGSDTHKLVRIVNQNFLATPNPAFFAVYFPTPDVNASYNAMNARLSRRFSKGYQFDAIYRWSKSLDTLSYEGPGFVTNQTFPQNNHLERGPSDYDVKHNLVISALWDLPILRNRHDMVGKVLGGWQLNTIITAHSGFPWTPLIGNCVRTASNQFVCPSRPIAYFGGNLTDTGNDAFTRPGGNFPGGGARYFSTVENVNALPGIGRNTFRGPRYFSTDLSMVKRFDLTNFANLGEGAGFELRANFFNVFNQLNLAPFGFFSSSTDIRSSSFGQATAGLAGRVIEFQARFNF